MKHWRPGRARHDREPRLPLPALPRFPAMRGYADFHTALRAVGFQHAAELLAPAAAPSTFAATLPGTAAATGFRILDGLRFPPARGTNWRRVDLPYLRDAAARWRATPDDPRAGTAAVLVDTLETVYRDDPMGVRRIVLWQLGCLLTDGSAGPTEAAATALGVHDSEAGQLAEAVAAGFPQGRVREAAVTLNDIWPGHRLHAALECARPLDPDGDWVLAAFLDRLHAHAADVDRRIAAARRLDAQGDPRARAAAWYGAIRRASDDETALAGLLCAAGALAAVPGTPAAATTQATVAAGIVRLTWQQARSHPADTTYRVVRFPAGVPEAELPGRIVDLRGNDTDCTALDADVPRGIPLHYAVVPVRDGLIAGVPRTTAAPVLLTPEATSVRAEPVPEGLRLRWRTDPAAVAVRVRRSGRNGTGDREPVECGPAGLVDRPLPPGAYTYEIACGYRGADGGTVWSDGRDTTAVAVRWPSPVTALTVESDGSGAAPDVSWPAPRYGQVRLLPWPAPVAPGSDVSRQAAGLAPVDTLPVPPPGGRARVTAVSVLGERAVAGASLLIEHPAAVTDLTLTRIGTEQVEARFSWPEPAVLVLVEWYQDDRAPARRSVSRSGFRAEGRVLFPVGTGECRVAVTPLARPDAVAIPAAPARAVLPAVEQNALVPWHGLLSLRYRWNSWDRWASWDRWRRWLRGRRS